MKISQQIRYFRSVIREARKSLTRSPHWRKVREAHLLDSPECAACGSKVKLQVHHVMPFHLHPELELDPANLLTLCMSSNECHLKLGHGDDYHAYNPRVREDCAEVRKDLKKMSVIAESARAGRLTA